MKRTNEPHILRLFTITILTMMIVISSYSQAFQIRGYDIGRTTDIIGEIDDAAANNMNVVTLSHDVCMDWFDIDQSFETYASRAVSQGLEIYFWNHVIESPPREFVVGGELQFDDPGLMTWLSSVYNNMMDDVPSMTGVVLSFTESEWQIHRSPFEDEQGQESINTTLEPVQRLERVIMTIYNTLNARGKKLMIRDFWRTNTETWYLWEALQNCPNDIIVYSKHTANDFRYGYPPNMSLGKYPNNPQIMEIEPSKPDPEYYKSQYQLARDLGMQGVVPRWRVGSNDLRDLNNECWKVLAHNPDADLNPIILANGYTQNDIESMSHFMETYKLANYVWGFYLGKHNTIDVSKMEERLHKGEGREMYTIEAETNDNTRRIRGLAGLAAADDAAAEKQQAVDLCDYWGPYADNSSITSEYKELGLFAARHKTAIKDFITDMYAEQNPPTASSAPSPPSNLQVSSSGDHIAISWNDNSINEDNFKVERQDDDGIMHQIALLPAGTTSYADYDVQPGVTYTYRVRAYVDITDRWNSPYTYNQIITFGGGGTTYYSLTTSINGQGSVSPSGGSYSEGSNVSVTATPAQGWEFDSWSGDLSGTTNPANLTMDSDKSVTAIFSQLPVLPDFDLLTPEDGSRSIAKYLPEFTWNSSPNADSYTLIIDDNADFSSPHLTKQNITQETYTLAAGEELSPNTTYYWKVIAYHSGTPTECNNIFSLTTKRKLKSTTSVEEQEYSAYTIYPNPASDIIHVEFSGISDIEIFNIQGKLVYKKVNVSDGMELNASELKDKGYFIVKVKEQNKILLIE